MAGKNPALAALLPQPVIRWLRRIIHEAELNEGLYQLRAISDLEFIERALGVLEIRADVTGLENLPDHGRVIAVSNHPLGGLDGMVLISILGRRYGDLRVPINDLVLNLPNLKRLFVPVNKHGTNRPNFPLLEAAFSSDVPVLHFPAGLCSRRRNGRIRDLRWEKSFIVRARRYHRSVVPIFFDGRNSTFFYALANLRRRLGIRANIEMVFLVNEMFKQRGASLWARIGTPIPPTAFHSGLTSWQWAQLVRRHVYTLSEDPAARFGSPPSQRGCAC